MTRIPTLRRTTTAIALVLAALLSATFVLLAPGGDGTRLEVLASDGTAAQVAATAFLWAQLPLAVGMVGVAHLLRPRTPGLAVTVGTLMVLSAFGHSVFGGMSLVELAMVGEPDGATRYAPLHEAALSSAGPFAALGLGGLALGTILLAVALFRARLGLAWIGAVLLGFVVVEFAGGSVSSWAAPTSAALFALGLGGLAVSVVRSDRRAWMSARDADAEADAAAPSAVAVR